MASIYFRQTAAAAGDVKHITSCGLEDFSWKEPPDTVVLRFQELNIGRITIVLYPSVTEIGKTGHALLL